MSDTSAGDSPTTLIAEVVDKYADQLVDFRRDLHAHPELSVDRVAHHRRRWSTALADTGWNVDPIAGGGVIWPRSAPGSAWSRCGPTSTRCRSTT